MVLKSIAGDDPANADDSKGDEPTNADDGPASSDVSF